MGRRPFWDTEKRIMLTGMIDRHASKKELVAAFKKPFKNILEICKEVGGNFHYLFDKVAPEHKQIKKPITPLIETTINKFDEPVEPIKIALDIIVKIRSIKIEKV